MLNIEEVARGLMNLPMQVNSWLLVPHPPPLSFVPLSLAYLEESFRAECVCLCVEVDTRCPCMEVLERRIQGQFVQF